MQSKGSKIYPEYSVRTTKKFLWFPKKLPVNLTSKKSCIRKWIWLESVYILQKRYETFPGILRWQNISFLTNVKEGRECIKNYLNTHALSGITLIEDVFPETDLQEKYGVYTGAIIESL